MGNVISDLIGPRPKAKGKLPKAVPEGGSHEVAVRKISNGFIARHSHTDGKGKYSSVEVYHPKMPNIGIPTGVVPVGPEGKPVPMGKGREK